VEEHNKILDKFVGSKIRERRKALCLTQAELAELLRLSPQQVQRYESGENTISMTSVLTISKVLNVKPEFFYENAPFSEEPERAKASGIILKETNRTIRILLVEDEHSDELLFRKAAEKSSVPSDIRAIQNPENVMDFLLNHKTKYNAEQPDLVIMDINMPRLNGIELLKKIRDDEKLKHLPVIMLTNSVRSKDMLESYASFANGFVQKNSDLLKFFEDVDVILQYWCRTIVLPSAA
jgi:CheY-like chemotaxis protein